jgi:hypothetical protein
MKLQPLQMYQGDDFTQTITVEGFVDLNGYTVMAQIRTGFADDAPGPPTASFQTDVTLNTANVTFSMPRTITQQLSGSYKWDLQIVSPTGQVTTILYGPLKVLQEVTRI